MKIQGKSDMEAAAIRLENVSFGYHGSQVLREIKFFSTKRRTYRHRWYERLR